jgi:2'-5' RNA ligase
MPPLSLDSLCGNAESHQKGSDSAAVDLFYGASVDGVTQTAIIVPVDPAEAVVGAWRREHTPSGSNGMPAHVTLLAPFTRPEQLVAGRMREVCEVLRDFEAFDFELISTGYLDLASRRVLYLRPEPGKRFVEMIAALVRRFPEHPQYGNADLDPVPHLTVATPADGALLEGIEAAVQTELPIGATATEAWIVEYGDGGCHIRSRIEFAPRTGVSQRPSTRRRGSAPRRRTSPP